jgi:hypothetical protein
LYFQCLGRPRWSITSAQGFKTNVGNIPRSSSQKKKKKKKRPGTSGSRYSGGRNQEDQGLKPAQTNTSMRPYLKNPSHKRAGGVVQGVGPEFKPQYHKKKKKKKKT